jgi:hypothetical protein
MKLFLPLGFILVFALFGSDIKRPAPVPATKSSLQITDTIDFTDQIQPILIKNCSPCHFTGGKMYEKMPFDKDTTIINHEKGILKRIKGDENSLIKSFILQQTKQ